MQLENSNFGANMVKLRGENEGHLLCVRATSSLPYCVLFLSEMRISFENMRQLAESKIMQLELSQRELRTLNARYSELSRNFDSQNYGI
jgi:hypothetical protein